MAYNKLIPRGSDTRSFSQGQILDNFEAIGNTLLGVDEGGLQMGQQVAPAITGNNQMALYGKQAQVPGIPDNPLPNVLAVQRNNNGAIIEFSQSSDNSVGDGWFRLPNGVLVKYQLIYVAAGTGNSGSLNVDWIDNDSIPQFTTPPFSIQLTQVRIGQFAPPIYVGAKVSIDGNVAITIDSFSIAINSYTWNVGGFQFGWQPFQVYAYAYGLG